jgi:hypothetical protein
MLISSEFSEDENIFEYNGLIFAWDVEPGEEYIEGAVRK